MTPQCKNIKTIEHTNCKWTIHLQLSSIIITFNNQLNQFLEKESYQYNVRNNLEIIKEHYKLSYYEKRPSCMDRKCFQKLLQNIKKVNNITRFTF